MKVGSRRERSEGWGREGGRLSSKEETEPKTHDPQPQFRNRTCISTRQPPTELAEPAIGRRLSLVKREREDEEGREVSSTHLSPFGSSPGETRRR